MNENTEQKIKDISLVILDIVVRLFFGIAGFLYWAYTKDYFQSQFEMNYVILISCVIIILVLKIIRYFKLASLTDLQNNQSQI